MITSIVYHIPGGKSNRKERDMNFKRTNNLILVNQAKLKADVAKAALMMKAEDGLTMSDRLDKEGIGHSTIWQMTQTYDKYADCFDLDEYEKVPVVGACLPIRLKNVCDIFGLNKDDYVLKQVEKSEEKPTPQAIAPTIDTTEIVEKLDEAIATMNKLGNILMQIMEYDKAELNTGNECLSELKKINDKYNKPSAYLKK